MIVPKPDLFPFEAPFPEIDGARICVRRNSGVTFGTIVTFERPDDRLFGVRIDIDYPPTMDPNTKPANTGSWDRNGNFIVEYLCLSADQIKVITRHTSPEFDYSLTLSY
jgi:hypothetical protein